MVTKYVNALSEWGVQDSTIVNHLTNINKWAAFVESYEYMTIPKAFYATIKSTQRGMRKHINRERKAAEILNTEESMIEKGYWPEGGIQTLKEEVIRSVETNIFFDSFHFRYQPTFEKIIRKVQDGYLLSSDEYLMATYFTICHFYVGNPQGRIGALNEMKIKDIQRLKAVGMIGSSHFKTRETYGVQFISACTPTLQ